jgi:hypothetical protein
VSKQLNRKVLKVNNRSGIKQEFTYVEPSLKSVAKPSIVSWRGPGKGVQGETTNTSGEVGSKQIINKLRKPM